MKKSGSSGKGNEPLADHKKIKNRLVPSFLTQFPMTFTRYADDVLPEMITIAILHDAHGYRRGAEICLEISRILQQFDKVAYPFVSAIGHLSVDDKAKFLLESKNRKIHDDMKRAFTPINDILYPTPIDFIGKDASISPEQSLKYLRECVGSNFNRYSHASSSAMATLYYTQAVIGRLKISSHLPSPDLEAIHSDPDSVAAQKAQADVRIFSMMAVGQMKNEISSDWPKAFWKRCRSSSSCEYWSPDDNKPEGEP